MITEYSIQKMVSDGTLSTIALGIQYLQRNDIYIRIAGEETPQSGAPSGYTWSFLDNTTLKILPVIPNGVEVVVCRRTDVDAMYNIYSQNAQFDEATIDENNQQLLYIAQEYLEQGIPGAGVDIIEFIRDDGSFTYYRIKRTDGSYSDEFYVPSACSITKVLARESLRRSYAEAGYNLVDGSFEVGGTLVNVNDVLLQEHTGKAFSGPAGMVAAGTNPTSVGFVDRSDHTLRSEVDEISRLTSRYATLQAAIDTDKTVIVDKDYTLSSPLLADGFCDIATQNNPTIDIPNGLVGISITNTAKGRVKGLNFTGHATSTDTVPNVGINTQLATVSDGVTYEDINASGLFTGFNLTKGRGNKVVGGKLGGMVYSPVTLGSAGGYGVLLQGEKDFEITGTRFVATPTDRHAVYTAKLVTDPVGIGHCENVNIHDVTVDWLATNGTGDDSKLPFPARNPNGWRLHDVISRGGSGLVKLGTANGAASNVEIYNIIALDMETRNNQFSAVISIGTAGTGYAVTHVRLSGLRTRIARGTAQPAARDCGGLFYGISQMRILDWNSTVDTGVMMSFNNCTDVLIDDIIDNVSGVNGPNTQPVIAFAGACYKFTVGNVVHNRPDIAGKSALFGGLENVTDMTCNFTRAFKIGLNGAGGYVLTDPWDLVASVTLNATNITVQFKGHVTQQAVNESQYSMLSATHPNVYRSSTSGKAAVVGVLTFAGGAVNPMTAAFTVEGVLLK